jgi:hypothetical protein
VNVGRSASGTGALLVSVIGLLWAASGAGAAHLPPQYEYTFAGSGDHQIGNAMAVAVDDATHDVYVADEANHRVEKFDSEGNFLFMFGDGVNETTGGNVCPVSPSDVCRPGQQSSPTFPHFESIANIAVDNSSSTSKGDVYVGTESNISKFDSSGQLITGWASNGELTQAELAGRLIKMGVSDYTGYLWAIEGEGWRFASFNPEGTQSTLTYGENWNIQPGSIAIDQPGNAYYSSYGGNPLQVDHSMLVPNGQPHGEIFFENAASGYAIDPTTGNIYIDSGSGTYNGEKVVVFTPPCSASTGYCIPKETFGAGDISNGKGLAVDPETGAVYVADEAGVAYFKPLIVPDATPTGVAPGRASVEVAAHIDPAEGGEILLCKVEYGPTNKYGSSVPCDQSGPFANPADVTATIPGLTPESTYHYRFVVTNANGSGFAVDQSVVPHWVVGLTTGEATEIGPGTATLHGSFDPEGEDTHYYFEWGTTLAYGHMTPAPSGTDAGSGSGTEEVETSLAGLTTALTTYHYRIVAVNGLGTSHGFDRTFTTPISFLPTVQGTNSKNVGLTSADLGGELNPGFGATAFVIQYGKSTAYGTRTNVSDPVADDGVFHSVEGNVGGLQPGTTYHFRVVALNFKGTVDGDDATFTTGVLPTVNATTGSALGPRAARLTAQVATNASSNPTTVHFEYGTSTSYGAATPETAPLGQDGSAGANLTGLQPGTTYHYRAVATNPFGTEPGPDQTFSTPAEASSETGPPQGRHCKRGFVRKKGHCVKVKHHKRHRRHGHGRGGD